MDSPSEKGKSYLCVPFTILFWGGSLKIAPALCAPEWAEEERGNIKVLCDERRYKKERGKAQMES